MNAAPSPEVRALMWVFDRLSVDGGLALKEQQKTYREVGRVLLGLPSVASKYLPNDWDDSVKIMKGGSL